MDEAHKGLYDDTRAGIRGQGSGKRKTEEKLET
jgi:hypothetical protein